MDNSQETQEQNTDKVETPDRFNELLEEVGDIKPEETTAEETTTEEATEETTEEKPTDEATDDLEVIYEDDKITFKDKDKTTELKKIDLGDGDYAYVPEGKEGGFLMQSDYTRKTMALSEEKKKFESEKIKLEKLKEDAFALRYIDELGGLTEEPLEKDYLKKGGKFFDKFENDDEAEKAYRNAKTQWEQRGQIKQRQQEVQKENLDMINSFVEKYGQEAYNEVSQKVSDYLNPFVFKEIQPYPKDALEIMYKGLKYEADIEEAKKTAELTALKKLNEKPKETKRIVLKSNHTPKNEDTMKGVPDRYKKALSELK